MRHRTDMVKALTQISNSAAPHGLWTGVNEATLLRSSASSQHSCLPLILALAVINGQ